MRRNEWTASWSTRSNEAVRSESPVRLPRNAWLVKNRPMGDAKVVLPHNAWVRGIAFDSSGETVLTAGYDGRLVW